MRIKSNMITPFIKLRLILRNIGILRFVPIIVVDILLPIIIIKGYLTYGSSTLFEALILQLTQYFLPFFSVWWIVFILREYLESDGNEMFYIGRKRSVLKELSKVFLLSMGNILLLVLLCVVLMPSFFIEITRIISACVFCFGLVYCMAYIFKSVAMTLLSLLLYLLFNYVASFNITFFPIYMSSVTLTPDDCLNICVPLFISGLLLLFVGLLYNRKYKAFN